MFGRNDFVENVKSALAAVDCDMGAFRSWQKFMIKTVLHLTKITYLYECEFRRPILQLLESGISGAGEQKHTYETATDRGSRKKYETLQIFFGAHPEHILEQMMEE